MIAVCIAGFIADFIKKRVAIFLHFWYNYKLTGEIVTKGSTTE